MLEPKKVFEVPVAACDLSTGDLVTISRYFAAKPLDADNFVEHIRNQKEGSHIATSCEWSSAVRCFSHNEQKIKILGTMAFTGTILDFTDETLKEGIITGYDGSIEGAKTVLGKKDRIALPPESGYIRDMADRFMPLFSYLYGLTDPKRGLPPCAYYSVEPTGPRPVVRGDLGIHSPEYAAAVIHADCNPNGKYVAWLVDEKRPENVITPDEYLQIQKRLSGGTVLYGA